jgi:predicted phage terminase large subunit-like protein
VLEKKRSRLVFAGQYQQHPVPLEGNLIKRSEVRYYGGKDPVTGERDIELPEQFDLLLISADCAFKDLKTSDYVAVGAVGVKGSKRFVLTLVNEHLDFDATELEIRRQRSAYTIEGKRYVQAILVEDKANGSAVISRLKRNVPGVIAVEPEGGKIARFFAAAPEWQAGDWYVDRTAAWTDPFVDQITTFPFAAHDDMCDFMSQAAIWLGKNSHSLGLVEFYKTGQAQKIQDKDVAKEQAPKLAVKLPAPDSACPNCGSSLVANMSGQEMRCNQCGKQWTRNGGIKVHMPQTRAAYLTERAR